MTAFPEWLRQVGLAHCGPILQAHGIDFDRAANLSEDDLRSFGLDPLDTQTLVRAIASRGQTAVGGERRQQLTIMFCDLVDYTGLFERLTDPEKVRVVRNAFVKACSEDVERYGGHVAQVAGDGLEVYFGWPGAHEDDPERSVRSALAIVESVKHVKSIEPLAAHIGIATGEVIVGWHGAGFGGSELAVGKPVNLASRLSKIATAHEIIISQATRSLVGSAFELTDIGTLSVAGIGPSQAWRVEGVRRVAGRFEAVHGGAPLSALVGRTDELALLLHDWSLARGGAGRVRLVGGEAGIGKSRLTQVLRETIAGEPHTTMRYQCSRLQEAVALHPIFAQLEFAAGFAREDTPEQQLDKLEGILVGSDTQRAESAPLFAALLLLPTERYRPLGLSPQKQREKTFDALIGQVEAISQTQPLLMIIEDAHWIDPTSQELVDALVSRLPALRILLVVTYRPQPPQEYTPIWLESAHVATTTLSGLEPEQGAELARNVAKGKTLPADVLEKIITRAEGLPLHIEELTKSVLESPQLLEEADRYTLLEPIPLIIPPTLEAALIARMGHREGVSELAQIGAFIGRVFSYELLAAVAKRVSHFDDELEELTRTELVFRRGTPPDATYTFKHALVQDAAYKSKPEQQRPVLHAEIADVLENEFQQLSTNEPELLAYHRSEAGHLRAAIPLWRRAGESALARVALQEAVKYLEKGLADVNRLPASAERDNLELSLREPLHSARLRWRGWAAPEVGVNATAILWLAQRQRQPQSLLIGLWGMWINTITQGRVEESPAWGQRLLVEGNQAGNIDMQIFGHRALLSSNLYLGELDEALKQRGRVLELYDPRHASRWMELTGNDTRTAVGIFASQALWMRGFPDQASQLSDQKDADARQLGHPFDIGWALTWGAYVADFRCEPDRLFANATEAGRLGREQSIPVLSKILVPILEGLALLRSSQWRDAKSSLQVGIDGWKESGGQLNLPYLKSALAEARARMGDLDAGLRLLDECLEQIERPGWHERVWLAETLRLKGWVLMRQGKRTEAEAQLRASLQWARRQRAQSWELRSATTLTELMLEDGRRDAARGLLTPVYESFTEGFETHDLIAARSLLEELR